MIKVTCAYIALWGIILLSSGYVEAADKELSFVSESDTTTINVDEGANFSVLIKVDDGSDIAGAAFTITYNTSGLTLNSVSSSFFGTFDSQSVNTPNNSGGSGYVTVDSIDYYSPIVNNEITNGTMIAAARVDNGSNSPATLFALNFTANDTGLHPISAAQSVITNVSAGYTDDPDDENNRIPYFIGIDGSTYEKHTVRTIHAFTVTVSEPFTDTDGDGIDDNWEITYRPDTEDDLGDLNYFTASGDYDNDGYSDFQEYLNREEIDLDGSAYDPTIKNSPSGSGFTRPTVTLPGVNLLLLEE